LWLPSCSFVFFSLNNYSFGEKRFRPIQSKFRLIQSKRTNIRQNKCSIYSLSLKEQMFGLFSQSKRTNVRRTNVRRTNVRQKENKKKSRRPPTQTIRRARPPNFAARISNVRRSTRSRTIPSEANCVSTSHRTLVRRSTDKSCSRYALRTLCATVLPFL